MKIIKSFFKGLVTIIAIVFGIVFIVYIILLIVEEQKKKSLDKEPFDLKFLRHRNKRLKELLEKKKKTKKWRDLFFKLVYPFARLMMVLGLGCYLYSAKYYYGTQPNLEQYLTWLAAGVFLISVALFLFIGIPFNIISTLKKVKPSLETWVYGKYLGISNAIEMNEIELEELENEIQNHPDNSQVKKES